jgi:hypothetical protein
MIFWQSAQMSIIDLTILLIDTDSHAWRWVNVIQTFMSFTKQNLMIFLTEQAREASSVIYLCFPLQSP